MARLRAFGSKARGSVGAVTYYVANGQQIAREKSVEVKNPKSEAQAVQRMKMAPAQKFYDAFMNILDHSWQNAKYGTQSRQKFMSEAMKQNGGPYLVKGFSTMIPGTYLVSSGSLPEVTCFYQDNDFDVIETSISINGNSLGTRQLTINNLLENNPWYQEGDKLTFLTIRKYDSGFSAKSFQLILRSQLEPGETDDFDLISPTFTYDAGVGPLSLEIISAPFASDNFTTAAMAIIHSRGNNQNDDARSTSRMCVSPEIYQLYYSESAYRVAVRSYQEEATNPLGAEWYLNNFPAGTIGRVVLKTITIGGSPYNVLCLVIEEAGTNQTFVLVDTANRPILVNGINAPVQVEEGTPTLPWSNDYMKIFNGTTEFLDEDTAYSKIMKYLNATSGTQLIAEAEQGTYTPEGGGQTISAEILAVRKSSGNEFVMLTCTYSDGFNETGGHGSRITAAPVQPEEQEGTLTSVLVPYPANPATRWKINVGTSNVLRVEIDSTILGIALDWNP